MQKDRGRHDPFAQKEAPVVCAPEEFITQV
jgi:hypothetical protein